MGSELSQASLVQGIPIRTEVVNTSYPYRGPSINVSVICLEWDRKTKLASLVSHLVGGRKPPSTESMDAPDTIRCDARLAA